MIPLSRRETLAGLAAASTLSLFSNPAFAAPASEAQAKALLDSIGENFLRLQPSQATSLGLDTGARASYRSRLEDRSAAGQARTGNSVILGREFDGRALLLRTLTGLRPIRRRRSACPCAGAAAGREHRALKLRAAHARRAYVITRYITASSRPRFL